MKTVIEMARDAGIRDCTCNGTFGCLERFAALVRADEREQRTWVGLTDGDIYKMTILMGFNPEWKPEVEMVYSIVRNLEAKLKEKNT